MTHRDLSLRAYHLTYSDVTRLSRELAEAERYSRLRWLATSDERQAAVLALVREALLRLLVDMSWVSGSIGLQNEGRVDITFTVDLSDLEGAEARAVEDHKVVLDLLMLLETITDNR